MSQALDRIRKVAKERKKERFTALFHHISIDLLEEAFYELKENAAPGVDRVPASVHTQAGRPTGASWTRCASGYGNLRCHYTLRGPG